MEALKPERINGALVMPPPLALVEERERRCADFLEEAGVFRGPDDTSGSSVEAVRRIVVDKPSGYRAHEIGAAATALSLSSI